MLYFGRLRGPAGDRRVVDKKIYTGQAARVKVWVEPQDNVKVKVNRALRGDEGDLLSRLRRHNPELRTVSESQAPKTSPGRLNSVKWPQICFRLILDKRLIRS